MTRNIFIFIGTFVAGAVIALLARAAMFNPNPGQYTSTRILTVSQR